MVKALILVVVLCLLISCESAYEPASNTLNAESDGARYTHIAKMPEGVGVFRVIDHELNVVCYVMDGPQSESISCVPLGE